MWLNNYIMPVANSEKDRLLSFPGYLSAVVREWKEALNDRAFRLKLLLVPGIFLIYGAITQQLGSYVEMRKGVRLDDKLLNLFPIFDWSEPIFFLLYTSLFLVMASHLNRPRVVIQILEMQLMMAVTRQICIMLIALEPPTGFLLLRDVFLENTIYPHDAPLTKDLFFSGHIGSIWVYFLCTQRKMLKVYLGIATILMSFMLLSMRVHYSYDVYGAVAFTTIIYLTAYRERRQRIKAVYLWVKNVPGKAIAR